VKLTPAKKFSRFSLVKLSQLVRANSHSLIEAKLYILAIYAIEPIPFSILNPNGARVKGHSVSIELSRVENHFAEIKAAKGIRVVDSIRWLTIKPGRRGRPRERSGSWRM
jgi:hypothetical protein